MGTNVQVGWAARKAKMVGLVHGLDAEERLGVLSRDAQYDLSCACGPGEGGGRRRSGQETWLYPATLPNGGRTTLFKTLVSNKCANDCLYCPLRAGRDGARRCSVEPGEVARAFMPYWRSGRATGIFLTSAVCGSPDEAMGRMIAAAERLRGREGFRGYLHLKVIPGASDAAVERALSLASAVSLNIETAGERHFEKLTRRKSYLRDVVGGLKRLAAWTGKGARFARVKTTTQFVVGASDETDREVVRYCGGLYGRLGLHRVFFSAYQRGLGDGSLPGENSEATNGELLAREHRLYQMDYLLRKYGFGAEEIGYDERGFLRLDVDPKEEWARRHPEFFPVSLERGTRAELLRVPGLGMRAVERILAARKAGTRVRSLWQLGVRADLVRRARGWIV